MERTAWQLAGDWSWIEQGYMARLKNGWRFYAQATASKDEQSVILERLESCGGWVRNITRRVSPDTVMVLERLGRE